MHGCEQAFSKYRRASIEERLRIIIYCGRVRRVFVIDEESDEELQPAKKRSNEGDDEQAKKRMRVADDEDE